jgi:hypothetical protein
LFFPKSISAVEEALTKSRKAKKRIFSELTDRREKRVAVYRDKEVEVDGKRMSGRGWLLMD